MKVAVRNSIHDMYGNLPTGSLIISDKKISGIADYANKMADSIGQFLTPKKTIEAMNYLLNSNCRAIVTPSDPEKEDYRLIIEMHTIRSKFKYERWSADVKKSNYNIAHVLHKLQQVGCEDVVIVLD